MRLSEAGLALLKQSEGFRDRAYLDVAGFQTIGYGHRLLPTELGPNGINEAQAALILAQDEAPAEGSVTRLVKVPLTQGQFDPRHGLRIQPRGCAVGLLNVAYLPQRFQYQFSIMSNCWCGIAPASEEI